MRELIAEIVEREFEPVADHARVGDGFGKIAEDRSHLPGAAQRARSIDAEQAAGLVERNMMANRRKHVENLAISLRCRTHTVGCKDWQVQRRGKRDKSLIARFLVALLMALQL